jgi:hypothetical protein
MVKLKSCLGRGHCVLEMPTGLITIISSTLLGHSLWRHVDDNDNGNGNGDVDGMQ